MRRLPLRSPPRMRGKVNLLLDGNIPLGITPAYAGKSSEPVQNYSTCWDHPRVCGEKVAVCHDHASGVGSPPRMRGKGNRRRTRRGILGITPAYAGKRKWSCHTTKVRGDHPRVCGEKTTANPQATDHWGSPPRVRGKVRRGHLQHAAHGITPAYAGKRPLTVCWRWQKRDHPRVCGEKMSTSTPLSGSRGSPPRVRGKSGFCQRSILHLGSPPRMRGKEAVSVAAPVDVGITPAYAGKSLLRWSAPPDSRDHPRVCGEKR